MRDVGEETQFDVGELFFHIYPVTQAVYVE